MCYRFDLQELFKSEVHTPNPAAISVARAVDDVIFGVHAPQVLPHVYVVLDGIDGPHGSTLKMQLADMPTDPVWRSARACTLAFTEEVEPPFGRAPLLIPPQTARRAVMARRRGYCHIRVLPRVAFTPALNSKP